MKKSEDVRIAWLVTSAGYGGELLYWDALWSGFSRIYPHCAVFCADVKKHQGGYGAPIYRPLKRLRLKIPSLRASTHIISIVSPGTIPTVRSYQPDLVVVVEFGMLTLYGLWVARLLGGCRVLLLVESKPRVLTAWTGRWRNWLRRVICRSVDLILTNNDGGCRYVVDVLGMPYSKVRVRPWLVSQPHDAQQRSLEAPSGLKDRERHGVRFIYVGKLNKGKGLRYLLLALARLDADDKKRTQVSIVGEGPDRPELESMAEALGVRSMLTFVGRVPYAALGEHYRQADVFVFPSLGDYRALVGFEALSYGLPVLISEHDGAAEEVVDEGRNGFRFVPERTEEFARRLSWMIKNDAARAAFGRRSKELSKRFTVAEAVSSLGAAVADCLSQPPRRKAPKK